MSEVKHSPLCYPPQFPLQGRLPSRESQVHKNNERLRQLERDYQDEMSVAAGRRVMPPCCKTLHISLCFDGTGNNLNNDFFLSNPRHPTNIARMFRASIGDGYAGGVGEAAVAAGMVDLPGTGNGEYFKYYMPGVGTPFPEVGDLDYSITGLALANFGEQRINWGLMMIIDALRRTLKLPSLGNQELLAAVTAMGTPLGWGWVNGGRIRQREFDKQLRLLSEPLRLALSQRPGQCRLLGVKLYVYGFSRGAAAARAFVSWLNELLSKSILTPTPSLSVLELKLPISVEYLGLLDTVASVGVADIVSGADGHMGWADGNQQLPEGDLVKRCLHLIASHEQRLCFPLESIRRESGEYPANSLEVLYPGVHSDQGGGYPPGDQGKAGGDDDRLLLSQIALNDLYADAFANGAPLKVPKDALPTELNNQLWRAMEDDVLEGFGVSPTLANRFNAWREATLGLPPSTQPLTAEQIERYEPHSATSTVEAALREQMGWITGWRIDRYAFGSLKQTAFYHAASDEHADSTKRAAAEAERNAKQTKIKIDRKNQLAREQQSSQPKKPLKPGCKDFDPDMARTQLREAAEEFAAHLRGPCVLADATMRVARLVHPPTLIAHQLTAEARAEREQMKAAGLSRLRQLFPRPANEFSSVDENRRGNVDESRNAAQPEGLLRALFDDQVHDSRAWFLYTKGREPFAGYFNERMVFFADADRRDLALYDADGTQEPNAPRVTQPGIMDREQLAQAQKNIDALWEAHSAQTSGVNDASA